MKTLVAVTALVGGLVFASGPVVASNCPVVIKAGRDAVAKMNANDPKVKQAIGKLDAAQKLHDGGQHSDSLKAANEALDLLGVKQ